MLDCVLHDHTPQHDENAARNHSSLILYATSLCTRTPLPLPLQSTTGTQRAGTIVASRIVSRSISYEVLRRMQHRLAFAPQVYLVPTTTDGRGQVAGRAARYFTLFSHGRERDSVQLLLPPPTQTPVLTNLKQLDVVIPPQHHNVPSTAGAARVIMANRIYTGNSVLLLVPFDGGASALPVLQSEPPLFSYLIWILRSSIGSRKG